MIHAQLVHADRYHGLHPLFPAAFAWLAGPGATAPDGRHAIDGDRLFAIVETGTTQAAEERRFESHRRYLDIQVPLVHGEIMEWAPVAQLPVATDFAEGGDVRFHQTPAWLPARAHVRPGEFTVFWPEDAHRPCCAVAGPAPFRKVVIKVQVRV